MKKRKRKKLDRLVSNAIRHPDNFSLADIARLICIKREERKLDAERKKVIADLRCMIGDEPKTAGFCLDVEDE